MDVTSRAQIIIQAKDEASAIIKGIGQAAQGVKPAGQQGAQGLDAMGLAGKGLAALGLNLSLAGIATGAIAAAKASIELAARAEQTSLAFETLLGSTQAAQQHLDELRTFAAGTPFEFNDLVDASKKMMAFGFESGQVLPMLQRIGDATAALGSGKTGIDSITRALGQMQAKTKAQAGEMLQLTEAGIPAWRYLSQAMGLTTAEVQKLSERGLIPAEQAIQAILAGMEKDFGGLMAKQANTAEGEVSNLVDALTRLGTAAGTIVVQNRGGFIPAISEAINRQAAWTEALNKGEVSFGEYFGAMTQANLGLLSSADAMTLLKSRQDELNTVVNTSTAITSTYALGLREGAEEAKALALAQADLAGATGENKDAQGEAIDVYELALDKIKGLNANTALRIDLERELKLLTGEVTQAELDKTTTVAALTKQLAIGNISQQEYLNILKLVQEQGLTTSQALDLVRQSIDRTTGPHYIDVITRYHQQGAPAQFGAEPGPAAPVVYSNPDSDNGSGGGSGTVPHAYGGTALPGLRHVMNESVLTRPEMFVPGEVGSVLTRQQLAAALGNDGGGRDDARLMMAIDNLPRTLARVIRDQLQFIPR